MPTPEGTPVTILLNTHLAFICLFFLTDEDTEAQRGKVTCLRLHSQQALVSKLVSVSIQEGVK